MLCKPRMWYAVDGFADAGDGWYRMHEEISRMGRDATTTTGWPRYTTHTHNHTSFISLPSHLDTPSRAYTTKLSPSQINNSHFYPHPHPVHLFTSSSIRNDDISLTISHLPHGTLTHPPTCYPQPTDQPIKVCLVALDFSSWVCLPTVMRRADKKCWMQVSGECIWLTEWLTDWLTDWLPPD